MRPDDKISSDKIEDLRPPDYWGRHVLAKVVLLGAAIATIAGTRVVDGDSGTLLLGGGTVTMASFMLIGAVELMRGRVSPLPGRDMKLLSPIACIAWGAGFLVTGIIAVTAVATGADSGERPGWLIALAAVVGGLMIVGVMIQIGSLSDQWPDKWRPPYARQQPESLPGAEPGAAEPSPSDERP